MSFQRPFLLALRRSEPSRLFLPFRQKTGNWSDRVACLTGLHATSASQRRAYASKGKSKQKGRSDVDERDSRRKGSDAGAVEADTRRKGTVEDTAKLIPGSQQILSGDDQVEYDKAKEKMKTSLDWYRREVAGMEARGTGRVTPDVLKPVRVALPDGAELPPVKLTDIATVGVREGTTLLVTVFEESNLKHVEKAIYGARIPHVAPQRVDNRTIKIPMPRPTVDARAELVKSASQIAEETRVQLRRVEQTSVKKGKYGRHSVQGEQFHALLQKHVKDVDKILADMRKSMGVK